MNETEKREIEVFYQKAQNYSKVPVSGVVGGPSPSGLLVCDFVMENHSLPLGSKLTFEGETLVKEELKSLPDHFTREVQVGIVLTPQTALEIGKWMIRHANDMLKLTEEIQDGTAGAE